MTSLVNVFSYSVAYGFDLVSQLVFQLLSCSVQAIYHVLNIPSYLLIKLLEAVFLSVPHVADALVNSIANLVVSSISNTVSLFYYTIKGLIFNILLKVVRDLLSHLLAAVLELGALIAALVLGSAGG